jgi:hypothetical protein
MKWLSAGLTFVNFTTLCGLFLGMVGGGLNESIAVVSFVLGTGAAVAAYFTTIDSKPVANVAEPNQPTETLSRRAQGRLAKMAPNLRTSRATRYRSFWPWLVGACFAVFAFRSFCWLLYIDGEEWKIQSPNNLGDLALHITYIKNFANGAPIWPDNPIYVFSKMRYPAGTDLFNALLVCLHLDLARGLIWAGLLASLATFYALLRWGGAFAVAGFLFNGGVAALWGSGFFKTFKFVDYQSSGIAWKSIPLAMFLTQRGLLYAIPAGLLLLWSWREKFFRAPAVAGIADPGDNADRLHRARPQALPFWIELPLYASLPLFHAHTFLALSGVLLFLFICGDAKIRSHVGTLVAGALLPATFFAWLISDNFHASSMLQWKPGWVLNDPEFRLSGWFDFWFTNFGILIPIVVVLLGGCAWRVYRSDAWWKFELFAAVALATIALCLWRVRESGFQWSIVFFLAAALGLLGLVLWRAFKTGFTWNEKLSEEITFLAPAVAIFIIGMLFKFAPWEWDNLKVMVWAYFLILPFLWNDLIVRSTIPARVALCALLFASGFISLFGGLAAGRPGFGFANRAELDAVAIAVRKLPIEARFAAYPTFNHPLLLQGRKVALGYPGHLWTQGFNYEETYARLGHLMSGAPDWRETARQLGVRYIFWGREEKTNYPTSKRSWEQTTPVLAAGNWGAIYDLESARPVGQPLITPR